MLWIAAWALVPWGNAGANVLLDTERSAVWEQSRVLVIINYAALSVAIVISLVGAERIARRLEALRRSTSRVLGCDACAPFRSMNNVIGPVAVSAAAACVFAVSGFVREGATSGLLRGATWLVLGIAIWSFVWTYAALQLGLHRLGGERLHPSAARGDPSLGLRPLGDVAFMGLWMLLALVVPVVVTGLSDIVGVAVGLVVLSVGLALFFLSLRRLHRQMADVKAAELTVARDLYAQAYEPVRAAQTLEALEQQRNVLGAADALEKRASAIHEWPIGEGTRAGVIAITTSVVAVTIARLILDPLGL